jgi:hypothetical protein
LAVNVVDDTLNTLLNQQPTASNTLLHELQLGEQLNECIHQSRRSDFSLMLAMLCDDVREQSQFILPKTAPIDGTSTDKPQVNNDILRKHFELPEEAPLALKSIEQINQFNQGQLIADNDIVSLHLLNALSPKPLAFRDDNKHIQSSILKNTSLVCQEKHLQINEDKVLNKTLDMHVEGWLKAVQTSLVKSKLVDVIAA